MNRVYASMTLFMNARIGLIGASYIYSPNHDHYLVVSFLHACTLTAA